MIGIIYRTTNKLNGKKYIGKHKCSSTKFDGYLGSGIIITAAIIKDGKENFYRQIIRVVEDDEDINELEKYYIRINDCVNRDDFYNISDGGDGYTNPTNEHRALYRANFIGEKNPMKRKEISEKSANTKREIYKTNPDKKAEIKKNAKLGGDALAEKTRKKVLCIETNEIFISVKHAMEKYGYGVSKVCNGVQKTCAGLHFKFI